MHSLECSNLANRCDVTQGRDSSRFFSLLMWFWEEEGDRKVTPGAPIGIMRGLRSGVRESWPAASRVEFVAVESDQPSQNKAITATSTGRKNAVRPYHCAAAEVVPRRPQVKKDAQRARMPRGFAWSRLVVQKREPCPRSTAISLWCRVCGRAVLVLVLVLVLVVPTCLACTRQSNAERQRDPSWFRYLEQRPHGGAGRHRPPQRPREARLGNSRGKRTRRYSTWLHSISASFVLLPSRAAFS